MLTARTDLTLTPTFEADLRFPYELRFANALGVQFRLSYYNEESYAYGVRAVEAKGLTVTYRRTPEGEL